ncbi:hypothetical protein [Lancefieldella rimae]
MSAELSLVATWAPIVISVVSLILTGFFSIRSYRLDKSDKEQNAELRRIQKQLSELQLQKHPQKSKHAMYWSGSRIITFALRTSEARL